MSPPSRAGTYFASCLLLAPFLFIGSNAPALAAPQAATASASQGRDLFAGRVRFANGGPACGACHAISTLRFPNGGLVGPDLSGAYDMLGPDGVDATLQTLFFPTMQPVYNARPLTPDEQAALKAFLQQAGGSSPARRDTLAIAGLALCGFAVFMALAWVTWRRRLRGVRAELVRAAQSRR